MLAGILFASVSLFPLLHTPAQQSGRLLRHFADVGTYVFFLVTCFGLHIPLEIFTHFGIDSRYTHITTFYKYLGGYVRVLSPHRPLQS